MLSCRLYPVHTSAHQFKWEWRSDACGRRSSKRFDFFHDCMEDARRNGFKVILDPPGDAAPAHESMLGY